MSLIFDIKRFAINDGPGIRTTVFMKGCPLRCVWCHNPEGIDAQPDRMYNRKKCIGCSTCVEACPAGALELTSDGIRQVEGIDCLMCGACAEQCPSKAMEISGRKWDTDQLMNVMEKERAVMERSGGGVTICGGEPLMHPDYLCELLDELGRRNFHRTVDTTLYASESVVERVAGRCELFLVDLKCMDSAKHQFFCGVPNEPILRNIKLISSLGKDFFIRIPLIDGVNSDEKNITESAEFLSSLEGWNRKSVNLLPYHDIGKGKHARLGTHYNPEGYSLATPSEQTCNRCIEQFAAAGITATAGG